MEASAHFFLSSVEVALTLPFHISSAKAWDALQRKCHCESLLALSKERRITIGPEPGRRANMRTLHTVCRRPGWRAQNRGETAAYLNPSGSRHRPGTELPDPGAPEGSAQSMDFDTWGAKKNFRMRPPTARQPGSSALLLCAQRLQNFPVSLARRAEPEARDEQSPLMLASHFWGRVREHG